MTKSDPNELMILPKPDRWIVLFLVIAIVVISVFTYGIVIDREDLDELQEFCELRGWQGYNLGRCFTYETHSSGLGTELITSGLINKSEAKQ